MNQQQSDGHPRLGGNYILTTDGSGTGKPSNPGRGAIGVVLRNPRGVVVGTISGSVDGITNTQAEYLALVEGLRLALDRGINRIRVFVDSELIVDQLERRAEVRADQIKDLHDAARELVAKFDNFRIAWVPRSWNSEADLLAAAALAAAEPDTEGPDLTTATIEVDAEGQDLWIAEQTDLPFGTVRSVLDLEWEFMVGVGIVKDPEHSFEYYDPNELAGEPNVVDTQRLAVDAERFLNIPSETALLIFDSELQYLRMRGLAEG